MNTLYFVGFVNSNNSNEYWESQVTRDQYDEIDKLTNSDETPQKANRNFIFSAFVPVRTNNIKNFAKDFFLPTFINQALTIKNMACRIFASIGAIIFDLLTLPIRMLTCVIRVLINNKESKNVPPLLTYLKNSVIPTPPDWVEKSDQLNVVFAILKRSTAQNDSVLENGDKLVNFDMTNKRWKTVNRIEMPLIGLTSVSNITRGRSSKPPSFNQGNFEIWHLSKTLLEFENFLKTDLSPVITAKKG